MFKWKCIQVCDANQFAEENNQVLNYFSAFNDATLGKAAYRDRKDRKSLVYELLRRQEQWSRSVT
jgi:hypothetical protein